MMGIVCLRGWNNPQSCVFVHWLGTPRSHGFWRFFAFEAICGLSYCPGSRVVQGRLSCHSSYPGRLLPVLLRSRSMASALAAARQTIRRV